MMKSRWSIVLAIVGCVCAGCKGPPSLMRTPAIYQENIFDLSTITPDEFESTEVEIFYATDRLYDPENHPNPYQYTSKRGGALRLGVARTRIGAEDGTWDNLAEQSTSWPRSKKLRLKLVDTDDFGVFDETLSIFEQEYGSPQSAAGADRFVANVNERLARTPVKDIYLYVAPFKVSFEGAVNVAAEFQHYMGRRGVFMAYSWPTRRGTLDYLGATENAYLTVSSLRLFLDFLARETNAEHIHLMTYSAGARVLSGALHELRIRYADLDEYEVKEKLRIGQVIFTGPDIDRWAFGAHYSQGMPDLADQITIYTTKKDRALGMSKFLFGWGRLGSLEAKDLRPEVIDYLENQDQTSFVRVTDAERANKDNAHGYFRSSPWVSSDILLTFALGLPPAERGLYREPDDPIWRFPKDYRETVVRLAEEARARED